jgi:hypothetical protein
MFFKSCQSFPIWKLPNYIVNKNVIAKSSTSNRNKYFTTKPFERKLK